MAKINGKQKGNNMERLIAKKLSEWSGHEFTRTPSSGGLHWRQNSQVAGDIVAPICIDFPFSVEIKKQEVSWEIDGLLSGKSALWDFYEQSCRDAGEHQKKPVLIFSKNRRRIYIMFDQSVYDMVGLGEVDIPQAFIKSDNKRSVYVVDFEDFLRVVPFPRVC